MIVIIKKNITKKMSALILALLISISLPFSVLAASSQNVNFFPKDKIISSLNYIEPNKELYGLAGVDFYSLSIGNPILAYEYANKQVNLLDFYLYPLLENNNLVAFALIDQQTNSVQITTSLVNEIATFLDKNKTFALIYDDQSCYAYSDGGLQVLTKSELKDSRRNTIDTKDIKGLLKNVKINSYSPKDQLEYYSTFNNANINLIDAANASNAASQYISCSVSYVTQNPPSNYCWASSMACIGNYIKNKSYTGIQVAQYVYGSTNYNQGATPDIAINALYGLYNIAYVYNGSVPSDSTIVSNLTWGHPLYSTWSWTSGSHACVISGINALSGYITVMDPESGFVSASTNGSTYTYISVHSAVRLTLYGYSYFLQ